MFINSIPYDAEAEEIAFHLYNKTDKLFAHLDKELLSALQNKTDMQNFRNNIITQNISNKLCDYVQDDNVFVVTIKKNLTESKEYYYTISAQNFQYNKIDNLLSVDAFGYAIDESACWFIILLVHISLLLTVIGINILKTKKFTLKETMLPFLFFALGRITPWIAIPVMLTFKPAFDSPALFSFWWVLVVGIILFILPIVLVKLFYKKALEYVALPNINGKGDIIGLSASAGAVSFLIIPYVYAFEDIYTFKEITGFILLSIATLFSGYLMGKILDENDKMDEKNLIFFLLTSFLIILTYMHGESLYLIISSLVSIIVSLIILLVHTKKIKKQAIEKNKYIVEEQKLPQSDTCNNIDLNNINERIQNPPYQKFDYFQSALESIAKASKEKPTYLILQGEAGSGKTATAKTLIKEIASELTKKNETILFLSSVCEKYENEEISYGMFHSLLDSTLSMDLFGKRHKDERMDKVITKASSFLMGPLSMFLTSSSDSGEKTFSKSDIYIFVKQKLLELSQHNTLIIMIDDLQWIDGASKELLAYLLQEFEKVKNNKIIFIFTARSSKEGKNIINDLKLQQYIHPIGFIDKKEQKILLESSFCLAPKSSQWIINWTSKQNSDRIYPYILVDIIANLYRIQALELKENSFDIVEDFNFENPPIPDGPKKEISEFLQQNQHYLEILSIAAVFGKEFRVGYVADALNIKYLDCIKQLDDISFASGLVYDVYDKDDIYQFRSQMILDAVRDYISYSNEGSKALHVPQIIRHYHALAANTMQKYLKYNNSSKLIMEIANHYYAAGQLYTKQAIEYAIKAASSCRNIFEYNAALEYLFKIEKLPISDKKLLKEIEELHILIECDKSHVLGEGALEAAKNILSFVKKHTDNDEELLIVAARTCYDAAAQNALQEWFSKTVDFSKTYLLKSSSILAQAEGHHFIAISLNPRDPELKQTRVEHLMKAMELTKKSYPKTYAKIANSLAEVLSYGTQEEKQQAEKLFLESLKIKENSDIKDLPGIARTYGGLGRLYFFKTPPDYEKAQEYFLKDLEIALEIEDKRGISQMNSFLGSCALKLEKYEKAIEYYDKSIELLNNPFDVHASIGGKLTILHKLHKKEFITQMAKKYMEILEKISPPFEESKKQIIDILEHYPDCKECQNIIKKLRSIS
jgi:tetratricopeptide (TPR) repeat protein